MFNVTMFYGANKFNQPLNNWGVSLVTAFTTMFGGASSFNQPLNSWNTSSATNMSNMFLNASVFNQDISSWDVSHVTTMSDMFNGCYSFKQNIGAWSPLALTNGSNMFNGANLNTTGTTTNYDALLNDWASKALQNSVTFHGGSSKYSAAGTASRLHLTTAVGSGGHGWTITDGGLQ